MSEPASKRCPYCAEQIRPEAIKCRYCGSFVDGARSPAALTQTWYRAREGKVVAGVCAGLGAQFGISVTLIRLAFVLGTFMGGWALIIYVALWVIMPWEPVAARRIEGRPPPPYPGPPPP